MGKFPRLDLVREGTSKYGTWGKLLVGDPAWWCFALECPDRNNAPYESCIPPGEYLVAMINSPSKGRRYEVKDVPGRSHILIHPGNWAAGRNKAGHRTDSLGCILLGERFTKINNQFAIAANEGSVGKVVTQFERAMGRLPFYLTIRESPEYGDNPLPVK